MQTPNTQSKWTGWNLRVKELECDGKSVNSNNPYDCSLSGERLREQNHRGELGIHISSTGLRGHCKPVEEMRTCLSSTTLREETLNPGKANYPREIK